MIFSTKPTQKEKLFGYTYLVIELLFLPVLLNAVCALLPVTLSSGQFNFIYFFINLGIIVFIFRRFLLQSLKDALKVPFPTIWCALLGYMGNNVLGQLVTLGLLLIFPSFANINDLTVALMLRQDFTLMAIGTILLVPIAEETLFRGLIFRGLYDRSPIAAYLVSMAAFSAVHVVGYVGRVEPLMLVFSFIQYLPAGYCLCFAYRRSGTIWSPVLMHMLVNAAAVYSMR